MIASFFGMNVQMPFGLDTNNPMPFGDTWISAVISVAAEYSFTKRHVLSL